jgi:CubicO group peptidase (beta-lactamase class C family)
MKYYPFYLFVIILTLFVSCKQEDTKDTIPELSDNLFIDLDQELIAEKAEWIDGVYKHLNKRSGFAGAILYSEKGQLIYKNGFGYGDIRNKENITTHSAFQLASVSKMFTATAIMILHERGLIDYDQDIRHYIPEFPYENVTSRLLLTHRSGLSRYMSLAHDQWKDKRFPLTNSEMLKLFIEHKPDTYFKPNNGFHYCNTNYALLANIVEQISGQAFNDFIKETIFDPLKMDDSFVYTTPKDSMISAYITDGVPGYRYRGWRPIRQRNDYLNGVMGDKGIYTSAEDLFKFDQALFHGTLVHDSTLAEAYQKGSPDSRRRRDNYGFGWRIRSGMDSTVYHYGWWKGFRAFYIRDLKNEKSIIVLSNRAKGPGSQHLWSIIQNKKYDLAPICWLQDSIR